MYDFCPLDLYSGNFARMKSALGALLKVPHRNLRLFIDGNLVRDRIYQTTRWLKLFSQNYNPLRDIFHRNRAKI